MENRDPQYSMFLDKIQFDDPNELKEYVRNGDGPQLSQFLVAIMETANKSGAFNLAESVIVSEVLERSVTLLSLIKNKTDEEG